MLFPVNVYEETLTWTSPEDDCPETESRLAEFNDAMTFRDLVELMREFANPSQWPLPANDGRLWLTSEGEDNYRDGETTYRSLHLMTPDNPRLARYWCKAARLAFAR